MSTKQEITNFYERQSETLGEKARKLYNRNRAFVAGELLSFLAVVGCIALYATGGERLAWLVAAVAMLAVYLVVRWLDVRNSNEIEETEALKDVYDKELLYHKGDFSAFADGSDYADPQHDFALDLDIFGVGSLFNRINRTITSGGSDVLAALLKGERWGGSGEELLRRREAIAELSGREQLRTEFLSHGHKTRIDTAEIVRALKTVKEARISQFAASKVALTLALLAIAAFAVLVVAALLRPELRSLAGLWAIVQFFVVFMLCQKSLRTINKIVSKIHKQLKSYISLIRLLASSGLEATDNRNLIADVDGASQAFDELRSILDALDRRGNFLYLLFSDMLCLGDFFLVRRFLRWQSRYMIGIEHWVETVSRFDARVSMATFRYNEPYATDAEVADVEAVVYTARGLYHPFLGEKAVKNDFDIVDKNYYIITGANMAGKSTFLRSVGINYVLARCGLPVFAESLKVSVFSLFSSMRTTDDLTHGISYFNAELLRLDQLLHHVKQSPRTLIILDEILKGTNSLDKLNGSRLFLETVAKLPVAGVVATHDLELSKMAEQMPDRFHNFCFEIRLSDDITYTYKISSGVAKNQNATFLLKRLIGE